MGEGLVAVDYEGRLPEELTEYLEAGKDFRVAQARPLVLDAQDADDLLNRVYPYLSDPVMKTTRVVLRHTVCCGRDVRAAG